MPPASLAFISAHGCSTEYASGWVRQYESLLRPLLEEGPDRSVAGYRPRTGTSFHLIEADLEDRQAVDAAFQNHKPLLR